ncbi:MAG: ThiF family adenylyltransferase [Acidovorax sp.]
MLISSVRLLLPTEFPAVPCRIYVDEGYFLKVPHVESDGHLCLGQRSMPGDYDDPVSAVVRALGAVKELLENSRDAGWVQAQFHGERASYWQHLEKAKDSSRRPAPKRTLVDASGLRGWAEGSIAAYVPAGSKHRVYRLQVACAGNVDPHKLATRHQWVDGSVVRGKALFVRMPGTELWTPSTWPSTYDQLDSLVGRLTGHECSVSSWLQKLGVPQSHFVDGHDCAANGSKMQAPPGRRPMLVVLVQDDLAYGFQLYPSTLPTPGKPNMQPIGTSRVDSDWALARDHQLEALHRRRGKRVLLLGAGSLGSPLAGSLARSGIGTLDIVDSQLMEAENTARHTLGMREVANGKAQALASRLMQSIPGIQVNGHLADAATWVTKHASPGKYDLVVECTAESSVRVFLSQMRASFFGNAPLIHSWTEPMCSAGHVVLSQPEVPWPADDPADWLVNASDLSANDTRITLPACSAGFHPYAAADIELVAAFAAQRVIAVLDDPRHASTVWSWVRSSAFFEQLPMAVNTRSIVPESRFAADSASVTRNLREVLSPR